MLGRETAIQKMRWTEDDWLVLDAGGNTPQDQVEMPEGLRTDTGKEGKTGGKETDAGKESFAERQIGRQRTDVRPIRYGGRDAEPGSQEMISIPRF